MNSIRTRLLYAHAELGRKPILLAAELTMQEPAAATPAQDAATLACHPGLVVGVNPPSGSGLEDSEAAGKTNVDERRAGVRRQAGVE